MPHLRVSSQEGRAWDVDPKLDSACLCGALSWKMQKQHDRQAFPTGFHVGSVSEWRAVTVSFGGSRARRRHEGKRSPGQGVCTACGQQTLAVSPTTRHQEAASPRGSRVPPEVSESQGYPGYASSINHVVIQRRGTCRTRRRKTENLSPSCTDCLSRRSVRQLCLTLRPPRTTACRASLSFTISQSLLKLVSIELVTAPNHPILCCPLLLLPPIPPSIRVFPNESALRIRWPKYWRFSFSISPSIEYSRLISFRIYWLDLLAVQGTLKSLLQHHSSNASIPQHSAFFAVHLSHPYTTTGKTIALTRWTFVSKVMPLLFNTLSRFVIAFLLRSNVF